MSETLQKCPINFENFGIYENFNFYPINSDLLFDPSYMLEPRHDYDLNEILECLHIIEQRTIKTYFTSNEYPIYAFLVLAREILTNLDSYYVMPISSSLCGEELLIFALSSLCIDITAKLVKMGVILPSNVNDSLIKVPKDYVVIELGVVDYTWYEKWCTVNFKTLDEYPEFINSTSEVKSIIGDILNEVQGLIYTNVKGSDY